MSLRISYLAAVLTGVLAALAATAQDAKAPTPSDAPVYDVEECCRLCPRALDPATYVTSYLKANRFMIEGRDGVIFRSTEDLRTKFMPEDDQIFDDMARIASVLRARGIEVIAFPIPPRGLALQELLYPADRAAYDAEAAASSYAALLERLRAAGFVVPDVTKLYTDNGADGAYSFFHRDGHWTPIVARRAAKLLGDTIKSLPVYAEIPRKEHVTKQVGMLRINGAISRVASAMCGGTYPVEVVPKYETEALAAAEDLFGDASFPAITLIGTSMSANPHYHFAGFLKTELQADILNVAKSGGSIDGAMTEYLVSDAFLANPPKVLIWEFVVQQLSLAKHTTMQRLVPRTVNGCEKGKALLENSVTFKPGHEKVEMIYNGGSTFFDNPSRELLLDVQFADAKVNELATEAWFLDGKHSQFRMRYNDFTNAKGRFVFELSRRPEYLNQPLVMVRAQLDTPISKPIQATVKLCLGAPQ